MTSATDGEMASSRLHISATLTVFIEVPKEVEQNRCNQGSRVSDPKTASPARCKESKAYKRLFFFSFFFSISYFFQSCFVGFFRGNDCLMTRTWVTINQLSSFIEPSSIWIAIKVSVTGNTARRNRPKLILFCFSVAALPAAKNEKDFVYLFIFSICTEVCADGTSDNLITFARHPHPLLCPTALNVTGSQSEHIT